MAFLYNIEKWGDRLRENERESVCVKTWMFNSIIYAVRHVPEEKVIVL